MNPMVVSPPRREHVDGQTRVTVDVSDRAPLWFSVPDQFADLLGDRADHALIALLMPAMKVGRDLHIGGTVTDSLLHQANNDLQRLLQMEHHDLLPIRVTADAASVPAAHASGVATASSGGVDSSAVLIEYFHSDDVPESLRVTHLLNNNVGAHGPDGDELWRVRCEPLRRLAADYGLPFVTVDSNLDAHYPLIGFLESVSMRNAAVAHLLSAGIGHLHVGSEISYVFARVDDSGEIARLDPMLLPLVSTTAVSVSSTSSGLTRVQRTIALIGRPEARYLDVCTDDDATRVGNCSKCAKCVRAMLTLEIAGHLQDFCPDAFTYATYADHRDAYIARVLSANDPLEREIRDFAAAQGWRWRASDRRRAAVRWVRIEARRSGRRMLRRFGRRGQEPASTR